MCFLFIIRISEKKDHTISFITFCTAFENYCHRQFCQNQDFFFFVPEKIESCSLFRLNYLTHVRKPQFYTSRSLSKRPDKYVCSHPSPTPKLNNKLCRLRSRCLSSLDLERRFYFFSRLYRKAKENINYSKM